MMDIFAGIRFATARLLDRLTNREHVGDWNTVGGDEHVTKLAELNALAAPAARPTYSWSGPNDTGGRGWFLGATRKAAHPGRVGKAIKPWCVVVHTTDMLPHTFNALVHAWTTNADRGACAHFLIGRTPEEGLVQFVPVTRNANHAGGKPAHGWFRSGVAGYRIHPNTVSVGIEVSNAGALRKMPDGKWYQYSYSERKIVGKAFAPEDVHVDERGKGWHKPTQYQLDTLSMLLDEIETQLAPVPAKIITAPNGVVPAYGRIPNPERPRVVGHVTLDPNRKSDPGPVIMELLAARA